MLDLSHWLDGSEESNQPVCSRTTSAKTHSVGPEPSIDISVLGNGIRVVTERMPEATSVSVGYYVGIGSPDEPAEPAGPSHFPRPQMFK